MTMEADSPAKKPNPNPKPKPKPKPGSNSTNAKKKSEFEYCKVCNRNHNEWQRHKYFPCHTKSLTNFLSRFQNKITDIRFFWKNPSVLRPEHASHNSFWCVFCDFDVDELGSSFVCNNAINHLSSVDHFKKLKHFMWKYGGAMDRVDTFRISEADVAKWEKNCKSLKSEATSVGKGSQELPLGPPNEMSVRYPVQDSLVLQIVAQICMLLHLLFLQTCVLLRVHGIQTMQWLTRIVLETAQTAQAMFISVVGCTRYIQIKEWKAGRSILRVCRI